MGFSGNFPPISDKGRSFITDPQRFEDSDVQNASIVLGFKSAKDQEVKLRYGISFEFKDHGY